MFLNSCYVYRGIDRGQETRFTVSSAVFIDLSARSSPNALHPSSSSSFLPVFSFFNSRWSRWIKDEKKTRVSNGRTIITICFLSHAIRYVTERTDAFFVLSLLQLGWLFRSTRNARCNEKRFTSYQAEFIFYFIFSIYVYIFDYTAAWTAACLYVKFIHRGVAKVF